MYHGLWFECVLMTLISLIVIKPFKKLSWYGGYKSCTCLGIMVRFWVNLVTFGLEIALIFDKF
jgi:hypothetical protein